MTNSAKKRKAVPSSESSKIPFIGSLRPIELIGIGLLVLAGLMYGLSKCGGGRSSNKPVVVVTDSSAQNVAGTTGGSVSENDERVNALRRRLYVCMDSLKMRKGPHKDSTLLKILPYGDELVDMGEYKNEQTIRVAKDNVATEPWIKVRTKEGQTGWIFGAGIRPYPKKRRDPAPTPTPTTTEQAPTSNSGTSTSGGNAKTTTTSGTKNTTTKPK